MIRIGLTGKIGSGKSAIARLLAQQGVACFDADRLWKELLEKGRPGYVALKEAFGESVLQEDGSINREALRSAILESHEARERLEALSHPLIRNEFLSRMESLDPKPWAVCLEAALLLEAPAEYLKEFDIILFVEADRPRRLERIKNSRTLKESEAQRLIDLQESRYARLKKHSAVVVLENNGSLQELEAALSRSLQTIKKK